MSNTGLIYPWLHSQWKLMQTALLHDRLPNGLLLHGSRGMGKFDFAFYLAKTILCEASVEEACGNCNSCLLLQVGNHPDFFVLQPEQKSKVIKIDQVRVLSAKLAQTSQRHGYQVAVIYPAESMNTAASNALLKTLEEPPGKVLLILIGHMPANITQTILSRCQKLNCNAVDSALAQSWLQQQIENKKQANLLLSLANGAALKALFLHEQGYLQLRARVVAHILQIYQNQVNPIAPVVEYLKEDLSLVVMAQQSIVMDVLRLQMGVDPGTIVNQDYVKQLVWMASCSDQVMLHNLRTYLLKAQQWLQGVTHLNPQLLLEGLLIRWKHVCVQQEVQVAY